MERRNTRVQRTPTSLIPYQLRLDLHARNRAPSPQNSGLNKIQVVIMLVGAGMTALQGYQGLISFHLNFLLR